MELYLILIIVGVLFVTFTAILARYKRCPSDKVLVIYGTIPRGRKLAKSVQKDVIDNTIFQASISQEVFLFSSLISISISSMESGSATRPSFTLPGSGIYTL